MGGKVEIGSTANINSQQPEWKNGLPYIYTKARLFFVNVPAAKARVEGQQAGIDDPGTRVSDDIEPVDRSALALYRKCPHLGCQIPQLCDKSQWFECLCHGSKYTVLGEKRDGPAPRGLDGFSTSITSDVYVVDPSQIITGPPIGTATFDNRGRATPHCTG